MEWDVIHIEHVARVENGFVPWPGDLDLAPDAMCRAIKSCGEWVLR